MLYGLMHKRKDDFSSFPKNNFLFMVININLVELIPFKSKK